MRRKSMGLRPGEGRGGSLFRGWRGAWHGPFVNFNPRHYYPDPGIYGNPNESSRIINRRNTALLRPRFFKPEDPLRRENRFSRRLAYTGESFRPERPVGNLRGDDRATPGERRVGFPWRTKRAPEIAAPLPVFRKEGLINVPRATAAGRLPYSPCAPGRPGTRRPVSPPRPRPGSVGRRRTGPSPRW